MAFPSEATEETMLHHLLGITQALAGQLDFQSAIQAVSDEMRQLVPYDHFDVCIMTFDGATHIAYETGLHTRWGSLDEHPVPTVRSPIRALLWGQVPHMLTDDAWEDERFSFEGAFNHPIFDARLRARLHVPLRVQGAVIGALSCSSHERAVYTMDDVKTAQHVADLLAPYFFALRKAEQAKASAIVEAEARAREEGLRLGALRLTSELEHERQRIGMDLHDQALGDLTRLHRRLARLKDQKNVTGAALEPIATGLEALMRELRRIIDDAKPNVLQLFGFEQGVEDLLDRAAQASGGAIATRIVNDAGGLVDGLPETLKVALFRIVQEAINNAAHHGRPGQIVVTIAAEGGALSIAVADDGVGFSKGTPKRLGGINNMRTRAQLVGAEFRLDAEEGRRGTVVTIRLPLPELIQAAQ